MPTTNKAQRSISTVKKNNVWKEKHKNMKKDDLGANIKDAERTTIQNNTYNVI